ncbi:hypothetical protein IT570_12445 [Candidatus Sumerlaeota bacterium]|nr:hypothetical protein [Candidatus Sumerlaeota bacterium]
MEHETKAKRAGLAGYLRNNWWPVCVVAATLPFTLVRAMNPWTLWIDELFSLLMAHKGVGEIIDLTAFDAHPPLYYFILKFWIWLGRLGGGESLLWVRLPNIAVGVFLVFLGWHGTRKLLGRTGAATLTLLLAINPNLMFAQVDLRNYMMASTAIMTCLIAMLNAFRWEREKVSATWQLALWVVYTGCAALAMWLHLLSAIAMFCLGLLWIAMMLVAGWRSRFARQGFVAHVLAVASFVPWLFHLHMQLEYLQGINVWWMSPPTGQNLFAVFTLWFPYGRRGSVSDTWASPWLVMMSMATIAPVLLAAARVLFSELYFRRRALLCAVAGLAVSVMYVVALFWLAACGVAQVFDGARYTLIALPVYLFGISAAAAIVAEQRQSASVAAMAACAGWLVMAAGGTSRQWAKDEKTATAVRELIAGKDAQHAGKQAYIAPVELIPYMRHYFDPMKTVPITELKNLSDDEEELQLLLSTQWINVQSPSILLLTKMIETGRMADEYHSVPVGGSATFATHSLFTFRGHLKHEAFRNAAAGTVSRTEEYFTNAVSLAFPEQQYMSDGYQGIEVTNEAAPMRWTRESMVRMRFDRAIAPGRYLLKLGLYRQPYPTETVTMQFQVEGEPTKYEAVARDGASTLEVPIDVEKPHEQLIMAVTHPIWQPAKMIKDAKDRRSLGFYFQHAIIESRKD